MLPVKGGTESGSDVGDSQHTGGGKRSNGCSAPEWENNMGMQRLPLCVPRAYLVSSSTCPGLRAWVSAGGRHFSATDDLAHRRPRRRPVTRLLHARHGIRLTLQSALFRIPGGSTRRFCPKRHRSICKLSLAKHSRSRRRSWRLSPSSGRTLCFHCEKNVLSQARER